MRGDFKNRGSYPGGRVIVEKPKIEILFAHTADMEKKCMYVSLCCLHLEYPSGTACQTLDHNQQFTFSQRLLILLSTYL